MSMLGRVANAVRALRSPKREGGSNLQSIVLPSASDRWMSSHAKDYTPETVEQVLMSAMAGDLRAQWELFDLMEATWPRLQKNLNDLKDAVVALDWNIQPWTFGDEEATPHAQKRKELCEAVLWQMRPSPTIDENAFEDTLRDVLDAWGKGLSVLELDWEMRSIPGGKVYAPRCTRWIHPKYYGYPFDDAALKLNSAEVRMARAFGAHTEGEADPLPESQWAEFPENKFLICVAKQKSGHPIGSALLRPLAWWWAASNFSASWLLNYAQIFGIPIRWANYDPSQPGLLEKLCDMLENLGSAGWAAFPTGSTLELKESAKSGTDNPQAALLDRADRQCDLLILGQTLTSDVGASGSLALGDVHERVRGDRIMAAASFAAKVLNYQFLTAICRLNYGNDDECPYFDPAAKEVKDAKGLAERDQLLSNMGVKFGKTAFYERHDIPLPAEGEETIGGTLPVGPTPMDPTLQDRAGRATALPSEQEDETASVTAKSAVSPQLVRRAIAESAGAREKWLAPLSAEIDRLAQLAQDKSVTDEELQKFLRTAIERLPDLFSEMDQGALSEALEAALGAAAMEGVSAPDGPTMIRL